MESAISVSEILGTIGDDDLEICATADTRYDRSEQKAIVTLDAFARRLSTDRHGEHVAQPWLPGREEVVEHLAREDAGAFTKDVFQCWVNRVRASLPGEFRLHKPSL